MTLAFAGIHSFNVGEDLHQHLTASACHLRVEPTSLDNPSHPHHDHPLGQLDKEQDICMEGRESAIRDLIINSI